MKSKLSFQIDKLEAVPYIPCAHREAAHLACENPEDHWALL